MEARFGVGRVRAYGNLPTGIAAGRRPFRLQCQREQGTACLLTCGGQLVEFATVGLATDFFRQAEQAVRLARHRGRYNDDLMTGRIPFGHAPGHILYARSEEHTSELQSRENLVCRLLLEKKKLN